MKTAANARLPSRSAPLHRRLIDRFIATDDGAILRVAFYALLAGTASVLFVDYRELTGAEATSLATPLRPILPPVQEGPVDGSMPAVTTAPEVLEQPLVISLGSGGVLSLVGTIDPGAAERFAAELDARGEYVQSVTLDSPGGSVTDALAMGQLIHARGLSTRVKVGALCASSCPIVFAGGTTRSASAQAAIGVHQIYAAALGETNQTGEQLAGMVMSDAQTTTASIIAQLTQSGIDPALWLHALRTPPERMYYFTPQELTGLKLVTDLAED
ncbi:hypothetical protein [Devosia sp. FKR38]|uniref:COG3904 family protein n=1 Tax=Devosia sp. FKR38 TaxID=2562312 RepID=UPI0020BDA1A6|nr:hypothetical protein [Devosia sp. FKR38]